MAEGREGSSTLLSKRFFGRLVVARSTRLGFVQTEPP